MVEVDEPSGRDPSKLWLSYNGGSRLRPNGLAFSCRERAAQNDFKKATISREAVSCNGVLLECTCSQWSGVVNSGHGACYSARDARRERVRGERLGEPQLPIGFSNLTCYLAPRRILASEMTNSPWSRSYRFVIRSAHKSVPLCSRLSTRSVA